ncbi:MAG: flagellar protein FlaG [Spirochaetales bacterium]|uniref:Flagellar protein FlaG n=1 Tax=Candidatus Thalassospirochaeta sargassi TaxID=3119039 RepID=A0AAJ1IL49_9SPIO|nr:flagellar protein FlaG [Spirochaetales bacterium]
MEIDLQAINSNTVPMVHRADTSSRTNETTKVKARTEENVKKQQAAKDTAIKQLETELQNVEEQRQKIDAEKYLTEIINITEVFNRKLKFSIDKDLDQVIVKVVDAETDKVIKEIPPEALKRLYAKMKEAMGLLIDTTV